MGINSRWLSVTCLLFLAALQWGTVRRSENPVTDTQTNPILYEKKMEEIKDGVKGAPSPTMKFYEKEKFLAKTPVQDQQVNEETEAAAQNQEIQSAAAVGQEPAEEEQIYWWETPDPAQAGGAASPEGAGTGEVAYWWEESPQDPGQAVTGENKN